MAKVLLDKQYLSDSLWQFAGCFSIVGIICSNDGTPTVSDTSVMSNVCKRLIVALARTDLDDRKRDILE